MGGAAGPSADDARREGVDNEEHAAEAAQVAIELKVRQPWRVWAWRAKLAVDVVLICGEIWPVIFIGS